MFKIFAVLLSLQLIIAPVAVAQSGSGEQFRNAPDSKGKADYISQIGSIVQAGVGTTVLASCVNTGLLPSLMVFKAGALIYIASELMGGKAQNDFHKRKNSDLEMIEEKMKKQAGGDVQKEALETALEDEKKILEFIKKRRKWLGAIKVIYGIATALAIIESIKAISPLSVPPGQLGICNGATMSAMSIGIKLALVAAYTFATAKSAGGIIGTMGSLGAMLVVGFTSVGNVMIGLMNTPMGRVAAFGVSTALIMRNDGILKGKEDVAKANIEKLERVLAQFNADSKTNSSTLALDSGSAGADAQARSGTSTSASATLNRGNVAGVNSATSLRAGEISPLDNISSDPSKNCWSNGSQGLEFGTNCQKPITLARPDFDPSIQVPTLQNGTSLAMDFADAVASGNTARADAASGSLAALASQVDAAKKNLLTKLNDELKANGNDPFDAEAEQNKALTAMENSLRGAATSNGIDLASLQSSELSVSPEDKKAAEKSEDSSASGGKNIGALSGAGSISEGLSNGSGEATSAEAISPTLTESLEGFESSENDISNRSEDSLWKQVSNRYLTTYPRFFRKKDPIPEASEPPVK